MRALVQISRKKIQQGFEKNMPKTLRQNDWRRLLMKKFVIFIYLHALGLRRCEDEL